MNDLFPPTTRAPATRHELATALRVAELLDAKEVEILGYNDAAGLVSPWFAFDVGERMFAIWRATGDLYECEPDGAVPTDKIDVEDLKP